MVHILIPLLAAAALGAHPAERRKKPHPSNTIRALTAVGPSIMQERALRRRVVRLARIKMLERREALLFELLAKAHAQTPLFTDSALHDVGGGVIVGPTVVTLDFLGGAILRVTVRNTSAARVSPLLIARMRTASGAVFAVSAALESLAPGSSREVDVASPMSGAPISVTWVAAPSAAAGVTCQAP